MKLTLLLPPSTAEIKNEWRYTCTVYMPSCLLQGKFTFVFSTLPFFQINIPKASNTYEEVLPLDNIQGTKM